MMWRLDQAPEVMRWYREFILKAPEEVNGYLAFVTVPPAPPFPEALHGKKMCAIIWCCVGEPENGKAALDPVRKAIKPALDMVGPMPHPALQSMFDALYPPGLQWYWKTNVINQLSDQAIQAYHRHAAKLPTMHSTIHLYPVDGAAYRVSNTDTAWSNREANWSMVIVGVDPDPGKKEQLIRWARAYYDALLPFATGGGYLNFMMEEGTDRVAANYGANYQRLAEIKARYDPENLFRINQNIKPAAEMEREKAS